MGAPYHQFCPVAKAMELLDERWTMLIMRELLYGSRRFTELRHGLPTMSPSLLSKRLQQLVRAGLVRREEAGGSVSYVPSQAAEELRPVLEGLGAWGVRWAGELGDADLDPKLLMWDFHRIIDPALLPAERTVVVFDFPDAPAKARRWWLVLTAEEVDVCDFDPGHTVAVEITSPLRTMVEIWRGDLAWDRALRTGAVRLTGAADYRRAVPRWFAPSRFAAVPRPERAA
ncbi:winged helix-turn-helix transcriptional regulator [Microlunatus ginsengisoli]|uniref:Helix-turn-helix domain-containing protein n=1 Tax=Microlunatus ginsengisoli TaxID=363863 RepID=A0ABP6ZEN2_9ACTN